MTEKTIPVNVEWALQGKTLGRAGARVLACSEGSLSKENFTELIGRFSLGTPDKLPQVSVSYLTSGTSPDRRYYLGMAIHKWAADVRTDGGELLERDDDNRPVAVTAYFCVPYQPLADFGVSYQAMYQEFDSIRLDTTGGPPLPVEFPVRTGFPPIDELAMQSAGRLLTGRPVCVLGAESATVGDRLEFIGAVAALLPYGFRTRLTAATWVRPTHRDHRFRLFFSATERDADPPDHVVHWGRPEATELTADDSYACMYDSWLAETVGQLAVLAGLKTPRSFSQEEVFESLDEIGFRRTPRDGKLEEHAGEKPPGPEPQPLEPPSRKPKTTKRDVGQILRDCDGYLETQNVNELILAITHLQARVTARARISREERNRYQEIIREHRLFRYEAGIGETVARLREELFKVAFNAPLRYLDYCLIEESVSPGTPDQALLQMILDTPMADLQIGSVVLAQLTDEKRRTERDRWYNSPEVTGAGLVNVVAGTWHRPRHAYLASVVAADFMSLRSCDPLLVREVLQRHGYLLRLLREGSGGRDHNEVFVLYYFLKSAYPHGFSKGDIRQILIGNAEPPSPALLAAILRRLVSLNKTPDRAELIREAELEYASRMVLKLDLEKDSRNLLKSGLAAANGWPEGWIEPLPGQGAELSGPGL